MQPKRRKVFTSSTNMRSDMVAVVVFEISSRSKSSRALTIQDSFSAEKNQVHVLSLETFLDMGMEVLKSSTIASEMQGNIVYHLGNVNFPSICRQANAWELTSKLIGAGAYPGPNGVWISSVALSLEDMGVLTAWQSAGLVMEKAGDSWQITDYGFKHLQRSRRCDSFQRFFKPREHIPVANWSCWEMID